MSEGTTIRFNGDGIKLSNFLKLIGMAVAMVAAFAYLQVNVQTLHAQVKANASQNELDKKTEIVVQHQQKQIDIFVEQNNIVMSTLQLIQRDLATLNTKLEERTGDR